MDGLMVTSGNDWFLRMSPHGVPGDGECVMSELREELIAVFTAAPLHDANVRMVRLNKGYDIERDAESVRIELTHDQVRGAIDKIMTAILTAPLRAINVRASTVGHSYNIGLDVITMRVELTYDVERAAVIAETKQPNAD